MTAPHKAAGQIIHYNSQLADNAVAESKAADLVDKHLKTEVGDPTFVFHELASTYVHVDVHFVPANAKRAFHTLMTSGMSDKPMQAPQGKTEFRFAELMLCLPPDWSFERGEVIGSSTWPLRDDPRWPVQLLRLLARFPHQYGTWLAFGHSLPNGDPPVPYGSSTEMCGCILAPPLLFPESFRQFALAEGNLAHVWSVLPLYKAEFGAENSVRFRSPVRPFR